VPAQTRLEDTVLDLTEEAPNDALVVDLLLRACQRRLTTARRLAAAARDRSRLRWRRIVVDVLADAGDGVQSPLERRYLSGVERAYGLPRRQRNQAEGTRGARVYRDVRYARWRLIVELDGREAHGPEQQDHDDFRDNAVRAAENVRTFRYGWRSVTARSCEAAAQVAAGLRGGGWQGRLRACGPGCRAVAAA